MGRQKIALIGCGYWGKHFLRICGQHADVQLMGVFDSSAERMDELRQLHPTVHFYDSLEALLGDSEVEAVIIATGLSSHVAISKAALEAGKHVLCEKPLTEKAADSKMLGELADSKGLTLMVGHTFEFNDAVLYAQKVVQNDSLGKLYYLSFRRCGNGPIRTDADCIYDLATHDISIANLLLGSAPISVSATASKHIGSDMFDMADIKLVYPGGVVASINVSWIEVVKQREMKVVGSNGMLLFNDVVPAEKIRIYSKGEPHQATGGDFGDFQLSVANSEVFIPKIDYKEPLREELEHFMDAVRTGKAPKTDHVNATKVVQVLEAIELSIANNGAAVQL